MSRFTINPISVNGNESFRKATDPNSPLTFTQAKKLIASAKEKYRNELKSIDAELRALADEWNKYESSRKDDVYDEEKTIDFEQKEKELIKKKESLMMDHHHTVKELRGRINGGNWTQRDPDARGQISSEERAELEKAFRDLANLPSITVEEYDALAESDDDNSGQTADEISDAKKKRFDSTPVRNLIGSARWGGTHHLPAKGEILGNRPMGRHTGATAKDFIHETHFRPYYIRVKKMGNTYVAKVPKEKFDPYRAYFMQDQKGHMRRFFEKTDRVKSQKFDYYIIPENYISDGKMKDRHGRPIPKGAVIMPIGNGRYEGFYKDGMYYFAGRASKDLMKIMQTKHPRDYGIERPTSKGYVDYRNFEHYAGSVTVKFAYAIGAVLNGTMNAAGMADYISTAISSPLDTKDKDGNRLAGESIITPKMAEKIVMRVRDRLTESAYERAESKFGTEERGRQKDEIKANKGKSFTVNSVTDNKAYIDKLAKEYFNDTVRFLMNVDNKLTDNLNEHGGFDGLKDVPYIGMILDESMNWIARSFERYNDIQEEDRQLRAEEYRNELARELNLETEPQPDDKNISEYQKRNLQRLIDAYEYLDRPVRSGKIENLDEYSDELRESIIDGHIQLYLDHHFDKAYEEMYPQLSPEERTVQFSKDMDELKSGKKVQMMDVTGKVFEGNIYQFKQINDKLRIPAQNYAEKRLTQIDTYSRAKVPELDLETIPKNAVLIRLAREKLKEAYDEIYQYGDRLFEPGMEKKLNELRKDTSNPFFNAILNASNDLHDAELQYNKIFGGLKKKASNPIADHEVDTYLKQLAGTLKGAEKEDPILTEFNKILDRVEDAYDVLYMRNTPASQLTKPHYYKKKIGDSKIITNVRRDFEDVPYDNISLKKARQLMLESIAKELKKAGISPEAGESELVDKRRKKAYIDGLKAGIQTLQKVFQSNHNYGGADSVWRPEYYKKEDGSYEERQVGGDPLINALDMLNNTVRNSPENITGNQLKAMEKFIVYARDHIDDVPFLLYGMKERPGTELTSWNNEHPPESYIRSKLKSKMADDLLQYLGERIGEYRNFNSFEQRDQLIRLFDISSVVLRNLSTYNGSLINPMKSDELEFALKQINRVTTPKGVDSRKVESKKTEEARQIYNTVSPKRFREKSEENRQNYLYMGALRNTINEYRGELGGAYEELFGETNIPYTEDAKIATGQKKKGDETLDDRNPELKGAVEDIIGEKRDNSFKDAMEVYSAAAFFTKDDDVRRDVLDTAEKTLGKDAVNAMEEEYNRSGSVKHPDQLTRGRNKVNAVQYVKDRKEKAEQKEQNMNDKPKAEDFISNIYESSEPGEATNTTIGGPRRSTWATNSGSSRKKKDSTGETTGNAEEKPVEEAMVTKSGGKTMKSISEMIADNYKKVYSEGDHTNLDEFPSVEEMSPIISGAMMVTMGYDKDGIPRTGPKRIGARNSYNSRN